MYPGTQFEDIWLNTDSDTGANTIVEAEMGGMKATFYIKNNPDENGDTIIETMLKKIPEDEMGS